MQPARLRLPPGPPALPWLGSLPRMARDPLAFYAHMSLDYGPIAHARFGPVQCYMVGDPELIDQLLNGKHKSCIKDAVTRTLHPLVGQGLLTSEGELWRRQRKLCAPPFAPKRLVSYEGAMVASAARTFASYRDGESRDFHADSMALTLEIVAETILGIDDPAQLGRVGHIVDTVLAYFAERMHKLASLLPRNFPTPAYLRFVRAKRELDDIVRGVIERARGQEGQADHLLARLLRARSDEGEGMSEQQLLDEAVTMLLAGHETTALALMYTVYLLANHPAQAAQLTREVDDVLGGKPVTAGDLARMPYLDAVVRESLRLYPPAYAFGREVTEPFELGGYTLPKGAQVVVSPFAVHRNPRYWREPQRFRPERWLQGETRDLPRFAYLPFGGGHRICIGSHFALMEAALVLATLVQHATLQVPSDFELSLEPVVTLRSRKGLPVTVRRRKANPLGQPSNENAGAVGCPHAALSGSGTG